MKRNHRRSKRGTEIAKNPMMKYVRKTGLYEPMTITEQRNATKSRETMKIQRGSLRATMDRKLAK